MHGKSRLALVGLALGLGLTGCGSDGGASADERAADTTSEAPSSPAASESAAETPEEVPDGARECSEVWQAGEKLPRFYAGCVTDGQWVERDVLDCSSGQRMIRFDETYYGVLGGLIKAADVSPLNDDADYLADVASCRG